MTTTSEEVQQGNRLIAAFMGATITDKLTCKPYPSGLPSWAMRMYDFDTLRIGGYDYNSSWDWLMPVVEKINGLQVPEDSRGDVTYVVTIEPGYCVISAGGEGIVCEKQSFGEDLPLIAIVYEAVVDFIGQYNEYLNTQP